MELGGGGNTRLPVTSAHGDLGPVTSTHRHSSYVNTDHLALCI